MDFKSGLKFFGIYVILELSLLIAGIDSSLYRIAIAFIVAVILSIFTDRNKLKDKKAK
ncbi:hypothetical protein [Alkaliphilus transvaalensis]|uniref:hypothetical protein n=1 Tax=Alkaliphilus transvaalensis TaxID=114628 RepID=UPI0012EB5D4D|nr:hypothetical protein [Alkaliphilus transvaalensis]